MRFRSVGPRAGRHTLLTSCCPPPPDPLHMPAPPGASLFTFSGNRKAYGEEQLGALADQVASLSQSVAAIGVTVSVGVGLAVGPPGWVRLHVCLVGVCARAGEGGGQWWRGVVRSSWRGGRACLCGCSPCRVAPLGLCLIDQISCSAPLPASPLPPSPQFPFVACAPPLPLPHPSPASPPPHTHVPLARLPAQLRVACTPGNFPFSNLLEEDLTAMAATPMHLLDEVGGGAAAWTPAWCGVVLVVCVVWFVWCGVVVWVYSTFLGGGGRGRGMCPQPALPAGRSWDGPAGTPTPTCTATP